MLDFLASGGETISDPDGPAPVFEVPIADPASLETLNFAQDPAARASRRPRPRPGRDGLVHRHGHGLRHRMRGARRLREREGAPARAPGAASRSRAAWPGRAKIEVFQASIGRRIVGNRRIARFTGAQAVVHLERAPCPQRAASTPASACAWRGASATSGASRCAAATALPGRPLVLPAPQLRAADGVQARLARLRRRAQPPGAGGVPARVAGACDRAPAPWRQGRPAVPDAAPGRALNLPPARGVAVARPRRIPLPHQRPPRRPYGDRDALRPPALTPWPTLTQLCQGSLQSLAGWTR